MFGVVGSGFLRQKGVCGQAYSECASPHHLCWTGGILCWEVHRLLEMGEWVVFGEKQKDGQEFLQDQKCPHFFLPIYPLPWQYRQR